MIKEETNADLHSLANQWKRYALAKSRMETRPSSRCVSTTGPTRNPFDRRIDIRQRAVMNHEVTKYCLDVLSVLTRSDQALVDCGLSGFVPDITTLQCLQYLRGRCRCNAHPAIRSVRTLGLRGPYPRAKAGRASSSRTPELASPRSQCLDATDGFIWSAAADYGSIRRVINARQIELQPRPRQPIRRSASPASLVATDQRSSRIPLRLYSDFFRIIALLHLTIIAQSA